MAQRQPRHGHLQRLQPVNAPSVLTRGKSDGYTQPSLFFAVRVLHLNRFNTVIGGKERYIAEVKPLLAERKMSSVEFCLAEADNAPSPWQAFFPPRLQVNSPNPLRRLEAAALRVHNWRSVRALGRLLDHAPCDIAHVHSAHHFSAATLLALARRGIPAVWTLHDYMAICPVGTLFTKDATCERCRGGRFHQAVRHCCAQSGLAGSAVAALDSAWLRWSGALASIRRFIAPSDFVACKARAFGLPEDRLMTIHFFAPVDKWPASAAPDHGPITFIGRLYRQKGAHVFLEALSRLHLPGGQRVVIAGDGPELARLKAQAERLGLAQVTFAGALDEVGVRRLLEESRFVVVPSIWYEVLGIVILEAFAVGRPVVAAAVGGIPEAVIHGQTGLLCQPGDAEALADQIATLLASPTQAAEMGKAARRYAETAFSPARHLDQLIQVYESAIAEGQR